MNSICRKCENVQNMNSFPCEACGYTMMEMMGKQYCEDNGIPWVDHEEKLINSQAVKDLRNDFLAKCFLSAMILVIIVIVLGGFY